MSVWITQWFNSAGTPSSGRSYHDSEAEAEAAASGRVNAGWVEGRPPPKAVWFEAHPHEETR